MAMADPWLDWVQYLQTGPIQGLAAPKLDYVRGLLWAIVLTAVVAAWGLAVGFQRHLLIVWSAKLVICLSVMLLYDYTYGVDPDGYYMNAASIGFTWEGLGIGEGTNNMRQLAWLHYRWISTSFNASRFTFALLGLIAVFLVYRAAVAITRTEDPRLFYVLALTPSILFWSSTLGKEPVSLFGVCAYLYGVVMWQESRTRTAPLWILLGLAVSIHLRAWLGPILVVPLLILGAFRTRSFGARLGFIALALAGVTLGPALIRTATGRDMRSSGDVLATAAEMSRSFEVGGSTRDVPEISSYSDLAAFAPVGMFSILFRPLPGEVNNFFGLLAGAENACLLLLASIAVWRTRLSDFQNSLVPWALSILILWAAVYSVVSFQNVGTASRYKLEITPLLLGVLLYLAQGRKRRDLAKSAEPARPSATVRPLWNN